MTTPRDPFEYTATGVLGEQRPTMLDNELHLRSELARSKRHGYGSYPGNAHCYGKANPKDNCGVAESLKWNDDCDPLGKKSTTARGQTSARSQPATFSSNKVFGLPARPSTPIHEVLEFKYQDDWIEQQRRSQTAKLQETQAKTLPPGAFRENRTSQLRQSRNAAGLADKQSLWHMPKFSKAQGQVDSFRSESERNKAHEANSTSVGA